MDYIIFYRTLDTNHAKWGPQWTHRFETVGVSTPLLDNTDVMAIHDALQAEHPHHRLEIVSILPCQTSVTADYTEVAKLIG